MQPYIWLVRLLPLLLTATASAQEVQPATLGAPVSAFEQALGGPNDATIGPLMHYSRCLGTGVDQFVLMAPNDQVWSIQRNWCELAVRSVEDRFADAAHYLPSDAVAGDSFTTDLGESAQTFVSASVAAALPAGLFHDCTGNAVTAGTLFVVADSFGGWYMGPGTCPGG